MVRVTETGVENAGVVGNIHAVEIGQETHRRQTAVINAISGTITVTLPAAQIFNALPPVMEAW